MAVKVGEMPNPAQAAENQISADEAHAMAEAIFAADPLKMGIYWPSDISEGDYDSANLVPALERVVGSSRNWSGAEHYLEAARGGQARQFIEVRRADGIKYLASQLQAGEGRGRGSTPRPYPLA
ncbi:hypothetical protein K9B33_05955 [Sphingobium sp. 3R8]|uniref:hypothetical protein n=1 Tax=Sphingobium sp. 3R8 TaxID=2874921 RepID=UPI001CC96F0B|nr:hypothetical protein [Sphingobium sp. 3R8]MBZ9647078.1 hypothetical protein [Sphingobium sp. 3R8]